MAFFVAGAILVVGAASAYTKHKQAKKARKQVEAQAAKEESRIATEKKETKRREKQTQMRLQKRRGAVQAKKTGVRETIKTGAMGVARARAGQRKLVGR